eukprot:m.972577 g.972577  ORF g.972577 m.972577 type:complete len:123 (+) comp23930_c0_seq18:2659-3027(+)
MQQCSAPVSCENQKPTTATCNRGKAVLDCEKAVLDRGTHVMRTSRLLLSHVWIFLLLTYAVNVAEWWRGQEGALELEQNRAACSETGEFQNDDGSLQVRLVVCNNHTERRTIWNHDVRCVTF